MAFRNYSNTAVRTSLSGSITDSATSLTLNSATGYPSSNFTIAIENEVIFVGSRSGTTCSSLTRGFDNTTAASHPDGATVKAVMTAEDFTWDAQRNLEFGKVTTDTPDDDFDTGSLDGKWTVVDGSSGTVSMDPSTPVDVYDLSTREDLLIQTSSNNDFKIRQDYTLPDGNSLILCLTPAANVSDGSLDDYTIGLVLNDSDTDFFSGNRQQMLYGTELTPRISTFNGSTVVDNLNVSGFGARRFYFRVNRDSLVYTWYYSFNGESWIPMRRNSESSALDNIWIISLSNSGTTVRPIAIQTVHWIRQGDNNLDPW